MPPCPKPASGYAPVSSEELDSEGPNYLNYCNSNKYSRLTAYW